MASTKKQITIVTRNNSPKPITISAQYVETEVIDGNIVADNHIVNPGVVYSSQP